METILSGRFDTWDKAAKTAQALLNITGVSKEDICTFYVGPAGHHAAYPIGGDQQADPAAEDAHHNSMLGGAIGAGIAGLAILASGTRRHCNRGRSGCLHRFLGGVIAGHGWPY